MQKLVCPRCEGLGAKASNDLFLWFGMCLMILLPNPRKYSRPINELRQQNSYHAGAKHKARVALTLVCALFEHECAPDAHRIYFPPNLLSTNGIYIILSARFGERQVECEADCVWGRAHLKVNEREVEYIRNWGWGWMTLTLLRTDAFMHRSFHTIYLPVGLSIYLSTCLSTWEGGNESQHPIYP